MRSHGRLGRGARYEFERRTFRRSLATTTNAHHVSPSLPSRRAFVWKTPRLLGYLASVQMKLVTLALVLCSSAECSSPSALASRRGRQPPGQQPGHHDQACATHSERCRGQRPRHHDQVPATHKKWHFGHLPGHHDQLAVTSNCRVQPPGHGDQVPA